MKTPLQVTALPGAKAPSIALDSQGRTHVTFGVGEALYLASSTGTGGAFSAPVKVAQAGHLALGMRRGPRLVATGSTLAVSAVYGQQGGGRDGELLTWRSTDGGKSWQGPATVNDVPGAAREGLHAMAAAPDGTLAACWLDLRQKGTAVFASVSRDGGKTWSRNVLVYRSPEGHVCECCHTSIAFTPGSELLVMFRNVLQGNRDMYLCRSREGGKSFTPAEKLGVGSWQLNACPMDGGAVAADSRGKLISVWRREETVYTCVPGERERRIEDGQQPWLAVGKTGTWCAWLVGRPGRLRLLDPTGRITTLAERANDPVLCEGTLPWIAWTGPEGLWALPLE